MTWTKMKTVTAITVGILLAAGTTAVIVGQTTWHKDSPPMPAVSQDAPVNARALGIEGIGGWTRANYSQAIVSISRDEVTNVATVNGPVYLGMDEDTIVFLEYAAWPKKPGDGDRLLVLDRKSNAVIADEIVKGLSPVMMKAAVNYTALAVQSKESTVYLPEFGRQGFDIAAIHWQTGTVQRLDVPFTEEERFWEIDYVYTVPSGIAIPRGPYGPHFIIFNPATRTVVLRLNNMGPNLRPTGRYYSVPGFGIVQSSYVGQSTNIAFSRLTQNDFSTLITNPIPLPIFEVNRDGYQPRIGHEIDGRPCLIWGENEAGVNIQTQGISQIVIYDLGAKKEIRQSLGGNFSPGFRIDDAGKNIYLTDLTRKKIFYLNLESRKITPFATLDRPFDFIDALKL